MTDIFKVGYVPYSKDLNHPGDRRRIGVWSSSTRNALELENPTESDLLVLSGAANLNYWIKQSSQPVILDLVDGYLGEHPNFIKDFARNFLRSCNGRSNYSSITFTRALKRACRNADAVIVASPEQAAEVFPYNSRVNIILDDHSELNEARNLKKAQNLTEPSIKCIFWEGFGYTIKHFKFLALELDEFMSKSETKLLILTNPKFARWGGYLGNIDAGKLIKKWFPKSSSQIEIIPWSISEVIRCATICDLAIIPIDTEDKFANLKPENKLLSMWHLGLPTLFSNTLSYKRVADEIGISDMAVAASDWGNALANLKKSNLNESLVKSEKYIDSTHTNEILVKKWQYVFETVLAKNE